MPNGKLLQSQDSRIELGLDFIDRKITDLWIYLILRQKNPLYSNMDEKRNEQIGGLGNRNINNNANNNDCFIIALSLWKIYADDRQNYPNSKRLEC